MDYPVEIGTRNEGYDCSTLFLVMPDLIRHLEVHYMNWIPAFAGMTVFLFALKNRAFSSPG
jgi:hypothetical protein